MNETLDKGFDLSFKALGNSMTPFICSGDVITVKSTESDNLSIGDIIFYVSETRFIVHRLIQKNKIGTELFFITKGDNRGLPDPPVESSQIKGKVVKIERGSKSIDMESLSWKLVNYIISKAPFNFINLLTHLKG